MPDRRDRCEEERLARECLYQAGLLEWGEYQRIKIRWQHRWRDSATLLDATPSHAPDCGCSECPDEEPVNDHDGDGGDGVVRISTLEKDPT